MTYMEINKAVDGNTVTLSLVGWLDTQAAPELEAALDDIGDDVSVLVIDCGDLEYISSSGIRQIVAAHKQMKGNCTLKNVSEEIMNVFKMIGLEKRIKIE